MPDAAAPGSAQHDVIDLTMDSPRQQPAAHHAAQEQDQPDVPQSRAQRAEPAAQRGDVPHPGPQDVARLRADLDKDLQEVKDSLGKRLGADKKMVYDTHKSGQEIGLRLMAEAKPAKPAPSKPVMHSTCAYMTYPVSLAPLQHITTQQTHTVFSLHHHCCCQWYTHVNSQPAR